VVKGKIPDNVTAQYTAETPTHRICHMPKIATKMHARKKAVWSFEKSVEVSAPDLI
jgi:hypothetical protein